MISESEWGIVVGVLLLVAAIVIGTVINKVAEEGKTIRELLGV